MNTEQFGQLLDMIGAAGEGSFTLAAIWLMHGYFTDICVLALFITVAVMGRGGIERLSFVRDIASACGMYMPLCGDGRVRILKALHNADIGK